MEMEIEEPEYLIEDIEGRRSRHNCIEYYIKWKGYSRDEITWEPEENVHEHIIHQYEKLKRTQEKCPYPTLIKIQCFERGLEPEKIMGATDRCGILLFLMKWKGTDEMHLVLAKEANVKCPQVVIRFYEKHIQFNKTVSEKNIAEI